MWWWMWWWFVMSIHHMALGWDEEESVNHNNLYCHIYNSCSAFTLQKTPTMQELYFAIASDGGGLSCTLVPRHDSGWDRKESRAYILLVPRHIWLMPCCHYCWMRRVLVVNEFVEWYVTDIYSPSSFLSTTSDIESQCTRTSCHLEEVEDTVVDDVGVFDDIAVVWQRKPSTIWRGPIIKPWTIGEEDHVGSKTIQGQLQCNHLGALHPRHQGEGRVGWLSLNIVECMRRQYMIRLTSTGRRRSIRTNGSLFLICFIYINMYILTRLIVELHIFMWIQCMNHSSKNINLGFWIQ